MRLVLEAFGEQQFARELLRFSERADDMRPVFRVLADDFNKMEDQQFSTQGGFGSGGWRPLRPATIAAKSARGLDTRILHATLTLRKSLTQKSGQGVVRRFSRDEMFVGSSVEYGVHHQWGAPRANLPRRRPVEFPERNRNDWVKRLQRFLVTGET